MSKLKSLPLLGGAAAALIIAPVFAWPQVPTQSYLRNNPDQIEREDPRVQQIIARAEEQFRLGELNLRENKREAARQKFDQAVDTVLESGMDVRSNPRLQKFYLELVERVYRVEHLTQGVPTAQPGGAQFVEVAQQGSAPSLPQQIGFSDQKFEPSPLDELSKLVLSEKDTRNPATANINKRCVGISPGNIELRGFHLGMSVAEVKARVPDLSMQRLNAEGEMRSIIHVRSNKYLSRTTTLKGVVSLGVYFFGGKVSGLALIYDDSIKWGSADEFVTHVADALALPAGWANYDSGDYASQLKVLSCNDFYLIAGLTRVLARKHPVAILHDVEADRRIKKRALEEAERKRRAEEQRKKAFKP
jgi:hypothetical protein